jgi:hypothetical protein
LEILPTGESGYLMTKTLKELQLYIHEQVVSIQGGINTPVDRSRANRSSGLATEDDDDDAAASASAPANENEQRGSLRRNSTFHVKYVHLLLLNWAPSRKNIYLLHRIVVRILQ